MLSSSLNGSGRQTLVLATGLFALVYLVTVNIFLNRESACVSRVQHLDYAARKSEENVLAVKRELEAEVTLLQTLEVRLNSLRETEQQLRAMAASRQEAGGEGRRQSTVDTAALGNVVNAAFGLSNVIPVVIMACDRPQYLERTLEVVMKHRPTYGFPVFVSQDCLSSPNADAMTKLIANYPEVTHLRHPFEAASSAHAGENVKYYYIASHYGWALRQMFDVFFYDQVILLEEDLEIAPDFFVYFSATLPVLRGDPTLLCVSAYNDNGKASVVSDSERLLRTDMFPGLGWMLTRSLWLELGRERWARGYWDDWLREPQQRKGRACIRPEVSRTKTFGAEGTSVGQFYEEHLRHILLNDKPVDFSALDLSFLVKDGYDAALNVQLEHATGLTLAELQAQSANKDWAGGVFKLSYGPSEAQYSELARYFGLTTDFKAGVPRTAYRGVVELHWKGATVLLVSSSPTYEWT